MNLSIIIVTTKNRKSLLEECLKSISIALESIGHLHKINIIIGQNYIEQIKLEIPYDLAQITSLQRLENLTPSKARNKLSEFSEADYFLFLDDDTLLPGNYIDKSLEILTKNNFAVLGGPDIEYPNSNILESSLNIALKSFMTTLNTRKRHSRAHQDEVGLETNLTLSNLWIRKDVFIRIKFDENFKRNEENIFLNALPVDTKKLYSSELFIYHKRRSSLKNFLYPSYASGFNRVKMYDHYPTYFDLKYFIPMMIFIFHLLLLFMNYSIFIFSLTFYLILIFLTSISLCLKENKTSLIPIVIILQPLIVLSYCFGQFGYLITRIRGCFNV